MWYYLKTWLRSFFYQNWQLCFKSELNLYDKQSLSLFPYFIHSRKRF